MYSLIFLLTIILSTIVFGDSQYQDIEVVFTLDTTGSMSGLLAGAKTKIWSIAEEIKRSYPNNRVKFGLVGYRDKGDDYVTKVEDLSDDFDLIIGQKLDSFYAAGGGDFPEDVNLALDHSINEISWSDHSIKVVFLVGDAPPHLQDAVSYPVFCEQAVRKGIVINTVLCGSHQETRDVWKDIAKITNGRFVQIEADGGMQSVETPMDDEIYELNRQLQETIIVYGSEEQILSANSNTAYAKSIKKEAAASRSGLYSSILESDESELLNVISGQGDLVKDLEIGIIDIESAFTQLDNSIYKSIEELSSAVTANTIRRKEIQQTLLKLNTHRKQHLKEHTSDVGFSNEVKEILKSQIPQQATKHEDL